MPENNYLNKYLKYKEKYLQMKYFNTKQYIQTGGSSCCNCIHNNIAYSIMSVAGIFIYINNSEKQILCFHSPLNKSWFIPNGKINNSLDKKTPYKNKCYRAFINRYIELIGERSPRIIVHEHDCFFKQESKCARIYYGIVGKPDIKFKASEKLDKYKWVSLDSLINNGYNIDGEVLDNHSIECIKQMLEKLNSIKLSKI